MILSIVDDPKSFVFTIKLINSEKIISQIILEPPINRYRINKKKQQILKDYPDIVKVVFRENGFTREQAVSMSMGV